MTCTTYANIRIVTKIPGARRQHLFHSALGTHRATPQAARYEKTFHVKRIQKVLTRDFHVCFAAFILNPVGRLLKRSPIKETGRNTVCAHVIESGNIRELPFRYRIKRAAGPLRILIKSICREGSFGSENAFFARLERKNYLPEAPALQ